MVLPRAHPAGYGVDFATVAITGEIISVGLSLAPRVEMSGGVFLWGCV